MNNPKTKDGLLVLQSVSFGLEYNTIIKRYIEPRRKYTLNNKELKMMELIQDKNPKKTDFNLINDCIGKHHFMQSLKTNERNEIIVNMSLYKVKPYTTLYSQGSPGNFWYIIQKGQVDYFVDGTKKKTFSSGECFGEFALMNDCPLEGTVKTTTAHEFFAENWEYDVLGFDKGPTEDTFPTASKDFGNTKQHMIDSTKN